MRPRTALVALLTLLSLLTACTTGMPLHARPSEAAGVTRAGDSSLTLAPAATGMPAQPQSPVVAPTSPPTPSASLQLEPIDVAPGPLGKLAYVQNGDLWVMALPDGVPRRLAHGDAVTSPAWSSSGRWLLAGQTVVSADGDWQRAADGCIAWSPVEDTLLCLTPGAGIVLEAADGSASRSIAADHLDAPPGGPRWSPDGQRIAYVTTTPGAPPSFSGRVSSLWIVDRDGSDARQLVSSDTSRLLLAGWSPDGRTILYQLDTAFSASLAADGLGLFSVAAAGGPERDLNLTVLPRPEFLGAISRDGLAVVAVGAGRETWTHKQIAVVDPTSGTSRILTDASVAVSSPSWSPDGASIAYIAAPDIGPVGGGLAAKAGMAARHLWLMDADGSDQRALTGDAAYRDEWPRWSAGGSSLLFTRLDSNDQPSLWLVAAGGGVPMKLADISITPAQPPLWFGYYGAGDWQQCFAWWQPPSAPE